MSKNVLITGINSFVGSHLTTYLTTHFPHNLVVHGVAHSTSYLQQAGLLEYPNLVLHPLRLEDTEKLSELLLEVQPQFIFHLAARSFVGPAITNPGLTLNTNMNISLSLFEAVRRTGLGQQVRILNVGSGDEYGFIQPEYLPVREETPFRPGNPYAVSKIAQEMLGYQYHRSYQLHIINTRAFNHLGPRQSNQLAASTFAQQIALAEAGLSEPVIWVGNLQASRDYTDVRDIVRAYWLALCPDIAGYPGCLPGEAYNVCSGRDYTIEEILNRLLAMARRPLQVRTDPTRLRPSDLPRVQGDNTKLRQATGWQPTFTLEQSLTDLLGYWRETVMSELLLEK